MEVIPAGGQARGSGLGSILKDCREEASERDTHAAITANVASGQAHLCLGLLCESLETFSFTREITYLRENIYINGLISLYI